MLTIRASSLWTFNVSPYKYKYWKFDADPLVLELGNILHYYARDAHGGKILLDKYTANLKKDLKVDHMMRKHFSSLDWIINSLNENAVFQKDEIPVAFSVVDWLLITWTMDKVVKLKNTDEDTIDVLDWKTSNSLDWYLDKYREQDLYPEPRIWDENYQWLVYGYWAMLYLWYTKCRFTFIAFEKKPTAKMAKFSRTFTIEEAKEKLVDVSNRFIEASELDIRPHKRTRYCMFPGGCWDACPNNPKNKNKM